MQRLGAVLYGLFLLIAPPAWAQRRLDPHLRHERVLAVVPLVGAGTKADPRRPLHAPLALSPRGIIAFSHVISDDGRFALVEFVARDRAALAAILAPNQANVIAFEKHKAKRDDIEKEFRKYKKDFDLDKFQAVAP